MKSVVLQLLLVLGGFLHLISGKAILQDSNHLEKVVQTGGASGFASATSTTQAVMFAIGSPAGISNIGGSTASFSGSSVVSQDQNTSTSVGGALDANCGGGQLSTYIAGQTAIGIQGVGNCDSIIISKLLDNARRRS